ncbi:hypothetical protein ACFE04_025003 [Oxalis oulophora]
MSSPLLFLVSQVTILLLSLSIFFTKSVLADSRANQVALICTKNRATTDERTTFVVNFVASMNAVTPQIARQRYATVVKGTGNTTVYAFGECMRDLDQTDCNLCFAQCKTQMMSCLPFQYNTRGGRNFLDGCYLRYDYYNFFQESLSSYDKTVCGTDDVNNRTKSVYSDNVLELVKNLSVQAVKNDGFFVGSVSRGNSSVYGLAQCWKLVRGSGCEKCLDDAVEKVRSCVSKKEGRVLNSGCYLRYAPYKFYDNSTEVAGSSGGGRRSASIVAIVCSVVAFVLIVSAIGYILRSRSSEKRRVRKQLGALVATVNKSKLNYSYEILEKATNYFHASCKLGQGGSGSVYKGVLPDGKVVAIKRLFFNTRQWHHRTRKPSGLRICAEPEPLPSFFWWKQSPAANMGRQVWNHYGSGTLKETVDSVLEGKFPDEEASRVLQIGLLCVQASPELRPAMSMVVKLLSEVQEIPRPTQPPFLNSTRGSSREIARPNANNVSSSQSSGNCMTESLILPR